MNEFIKASCVSALCRQVFGYAASQEWRGRSEALYIAPCALAAALLTPALAVQVSSTLYFWAKPGVLC